MEIGNMGIRKPSKVLEPFVRCYMSVDVTVTGIVEPYRVLPQGCVELMFFYKYPYADSRTNSSLPHTVVMGQQSRYFDLQTQGDVGLFSVMFEPHGAAMFFDTPINEVSDISASLRDFSGKNSSELEERIFLAKTFTDRIEILETYLLKRIHGRELGEFQRMDQVMKSIKELKGGISIEQMSYLSCLGKRQLGRVFLKMVGLTPKQYLKIVRFQYVLNTKLINPKMNMTHLAIECGYHDQAHFARDFRKIAGMPPRKYFTEALENRCDWEDLTNLFSDTSF